jgi:hypothetical protein
MGGKAIKNCSPVQQEEVFSIVEDIRNKLNVSKDDLVVVGSAGLKNPGELSSDIDLAFENSDILQQIIKYFDGDDSIQKKNSLLSVGVYSVGWKFKNKVVQVDFMPVLSLDYAKWSFHGGTKDSKFKGIYRSLLMYAIAKYAYKKTDSTIKKRMWYSQNYGIMTGEVVYKGKTQKVIKKEHITTHPVKASYILFGVDSSKTKTFEDCVHAMMAPGFPHRENLTEIWEEFFNSVEKKKLPKGIIMQFLKDKKYV